MKYLKIEQYKGYFFTETSNYEEIDKIGKTELFYLLNKATEDDNFEMDKFQDDNIGNKAQQIIYKNLFDKFTHLVQNKTRFKDESEQLYKDALEKYS